jgi:hypothetical protein
MKREAREKSTSKSFSIGRQLIGCFTQLALAGLAWPDLAWFGLTWPGLAVLLLWCSFYGTICFSSFSFSFAFGVWSKSVSLFMANFPFSFGSLSESFLYYIRIRESTLNDKSLRQFDISILSPILRHSNYPTISLQLCHVAHYLFYYVLQLYCYAYYLCYVICNFVFSHLCIIKIVTRNITK